jgi:hypothetical protein
MTILKLDDVGIRDAFGEHSSERCREDGQKQTSSDHDGRAAAGDFATRPVRRTRTRWDDDQSLRGSLPAGRRIAKVIYPFRRP